MDRIKKENFEKQIEKILVSDANINSKRLAINALIKENMSLNDTKIFKMAAEIDFAQRKVDFKKQKYKEAVSDRRAFEKMLDENQRQYYISLYNLPEDATLEQGEQVSYEAYRRKEVGLPISATAEELAIAEQKADDERQRQYYISLYNLPEDATLEQCEQVSYEAYRRK